MDKVLKMLDLPRIEDVINKRRLKWIGKIVRMEDDRLPKKILFSWIEEKTMEKDQWKEKKRFNIGTSFKLRYGYQMSSIIKRGLSMNKEIAIVNQWGSTVYKNWMKIAAKSNKWNEFIAYCPITTNEHLVLKKGEFVRMKETKKASHEQKVERELRKLNRRRSGVFN